MGDKRRYHRINIELPASFKASDDHKHISIGTTFDFSAMGICISSKEKLKVGQKLPIDIKLPQGEQVTIQTRVVWVQDKMAYDTAEYKIGLEVLEESGADGIKFVKFYAHKLLALFKPKEE